MKIHLFLALTVSSCITTFSQPIYDPFDYSVSSELAGQGGWVLQSGVSGTMTLGSLVVPGLGHPHGNSFSWNNDMMSVRLPFTPVNSGSLYFSFALRIDALSASTSSETIAGFARGTDTIFPLKINVTSNAPGLYQIGIYKNVGTVFGAVAPELLHTGDTEFIVARYTFNPGTDDDTVDLWLNPDSASFSAASPPAPTIADAGIGGTDGNRLERFFFRSSGNGPELKTADELRIGSSWSEVTPIPEPTTLSVLALGVVALTLNRHSLKTNLLSVA
jgi:hypothetical protein